MTEVSFRTSLSASCSSHWEDHDARGIQVRLFACEGSSSGSSMNNEGPGLVLVTQPQFKLESLILAQNERWRSVLDMQVERERRLRVISKVAHG